MERRYFSLKVTSYSIFVALVLITAYLYFPALYSHFVYDDFYNLAELSEIKNKGFLYYIFGGFSGPTGRPVSLFSFALQYQDWPHNPVAFKTVNLLIHLVNGALIWFISKRLILQVEENNSLQSLFALLTTSIWLLHPIHLTTVLYVVQRMTELSCLFTLIGISAYLFYREKLDLDKTYAAYIKISIVIFISTLLAVLAKENGILLLLYILVIEHTLLVGLPKTDRFKIWARIFLVGPLLLLAIYLVINFDRTLLNYHFRDFTMLQRLMTEAVVLMSYLKSIILPAYGDFTLYHDDFPISKGLLEPKKTLFSICIIIGSLIYAIAYNRKITVLSFTILWFLAGHVLESTYLNLELVFEHRNYLPSFGIIFGVVYLLIQFLKEVEKKLIPKVFIFLYIALITTVFCLEVKIWSQPAVQAFEWARLHPGSERALNNLANIYIRTNEFQNAISTYEKVDNLKPESIYSSIQILLVKSCHAKSVIINTEWESIFEKAGSAKAYGQRMIAVFDRYLTGVLKGECRHDDLEHLYSLLLILKNNSNFKFIQGYIYEFLATIKLSLKEYEQSLTFMHEAVRIRPTVSNYIFNIKLLRIMGKDREADKLINKYRELINKDPRKYIAYNKIIDSL